MDDAIEKRRIMVIDDDESVRVFHRTVLEEEGYEVDTAEHVGMALEKMSAMRPDLILLDIRMPGVDGMRAARMFKHDLRLKDVPILMISSCRDEDVLEKLEDYGASGILFKPYDVDLLYKRVHAILERPTGAGTGAFTIE